jgi:hypothetical protein
MAMLSWKIQANRASVSAVILRLRLLDVIDDDLLGCYDFDSLRVASAYGVLLSILYFHRTDDKGSLSDRVTTCFHWARRTQWIGGLGWMIWEMVASVFSSMKSHESSRENGLIFVQLLIVLIMISNC